MPNAKGTALPVITSLQPGDLFYVVDDPGGDPKSSMAPISTIQNYISAGSFNVRQYGAVGNGVANDTAAINAAFAAVNVANGGRVYFPSGTYLVSSTINIPLYDQHPIIIEGDGITSIINYTAVDGSDCFYAQGIAPNLVIRDLCLVGAGSGAATGNGIHTYFAQHVYIENVKVTKFGGGVGIYLQGTWASEVINCTVYENNMGVQVGPRATSIYGYGYDMQGTSNIIQGLTSSQNNEAGINLVGDAAPLLLTTIRDCMIQGEKKDAIRFYKARYVTIDGLYLESNNSSATVGCADLRTTDNLEGLTLHQVTQTGTPVFIDFTVGASLSNYLMTNVDHSGTLVLGAVCLNVIFRNVSLVGLSDSSLNLIVYDYQHLRASDAWTPGIVAAGGVVTKDIDFIVEISGDANAVAKLATGTGALGTVLYCKPTYQTSHSVRVILINLTGAQVDYPATTVYVDCWSARSPY